MLNNGFIQILPLPLLRLGLLIAFAHEHLHLLQVQVQALMRDGVEDLARVQKVFEVLVALHAVTWEQLNWRARHAGRHVEARGDGVPRADVVPETEAHPFVARRGALGEIYLENTFELHFFFYSIVAIQRRHIDAVAGVLYILDLTQCAVGRLDGRVELVLVGGDRLHEPFE